MRICHITSRHPWNDGRIFQRACNGLQNEGHEVHLIATLKGIKPVQSNIIFHWLKDRKGISQRIFSSFEAYIFAIRIHADIYHFHDPDLLPWMLILSHMGKNVIYDVHENYMERINCMNLPGFLKRWLVNIWLKFQDFCIKNFSGVVTTTKTMQTIFSDTTTPMIAISNVPYIRNLIDIRGQINKDLYTVYTSGSHSDKRNCIQTIEALPLVHKMYPHAKVIFAGTFDPQNYDTVLKAKARELRIEEYVIIEGMLPYKENFLRTARMEIGCVFYEDNVNNRVTIPNRIFEYMYSGVAVLGESFIEVEQIINESQCGTVVNSSDPNSIAEGIIFLFSDIERLRLMQKNGNERVISIYAFEHELKKLISFYTTIIQNS